ERRGRPARTKRRADLPGPSVQLEHAGQHAARGARRARRGPGELQPNGGERDDGIALGVEPLRTTRLSLYGSDVVRGELWLAVPEGVRRHRHADLDRLRPRGIERHRRAPSLGDEVMVVQRRGEETLAEDVDDEPALGVVD